MPEVAIDEPVNHAPSALGLCERLPVLEHGPRPSINRERDPKFGPAVLNPVEDDARCFSLEFSTISERDDSRTNGLKWVPGEDFHIDFARGAWTNDQGIRRRPYLFRGVLGFSQKGYTEATWSLTTEHFIRRLENAFLSFGGAPRNVIVKPGLDLLPVKWFSPEDNPKLSSFAQHYGIRIVSSPPNCTASAAIGASFVEKTALRGMEFSSLDQQNSYLANWERTSADLHASLLAGLSRSEFFRTAEKKSLAALPEIRFPFFDEAWRKVRANGHVEFNGAFYSVPAYYVKRRVYVRVGTGRVGVYNIHHDLIALHDEVRSGCFSPL